MVHALSCSLSYTHFPTHSLTHTHKLIGKGIECSLNRLLSHLRARVHHMSMGVRDVCEPVRHCLLGSVRCDDWDSVEWCLLHSGEWVRGYSPTSFNPLVHSLTEIIRAYGESAGVDITEADVSGGGDGCNTLLPLSLRTARALFSSLGKTRHQGEWWRRFKQ